MFPLWERGIVKTIINEQIHAYLVTCETSSDPNFDIIIG